MKNTKSKKKVATKTTEKFVKATQEQPKIQPIKKQSQVNMGPVWFYGRKKLVMAFELGLNLSENARALGIELNRDIVVEAENILFKEFFGVSANKASGRFRMMILAVLAKHVAKNMIADIEKKDK